MPAEQNIKKKKRDIHGSLLLTVTCIHCMRELVGVEH